MANQNLFKSNSQRGCKTNTTNAAGGRAYALSDKGALAQMVCTGVFADTFYTSAAEQLSQAKELAGRVDAEFIAKLAVYARQSAFMKDMPAYLCAVLAARDVALLETVFDRVLDNGKMLRNFVQIVRSGEAGRKSLGTRPRKLVARWLEEASDAKLLAASVGNAPTLADVICLSHPKAGSAQREAFFRWIMGRDTGDATLPENVLALKAFREGSADVPRAPFELLTSAASSVEQWQAIVRGSTWTQLRMNLNTYQRQGAFDSKDGRALVAEVARRLADEQEIRSAKVLPYQLLTTFLNVSDEVPVEICVALQDALEISLDNVPQIEGGVAVLVDTSGSMKSPVTGQRVGATTKTRCVDVAALVGAAMLRKNPDACLVPFDSQVHVKTKFNPRDSLATNTMKLAQFGGGSTRCGAAMAHLNAVQSRANLVLMVSDNESWVQWQDYRGAGTEICEEWKKYKKRVPKAKLVCLDLTPNRSTQVPSRMDVLNIGGFSDAVFDVIANFAQGKTSAEYWVDTIEKVVL